MPRCLSYRKDQGREFANYACTTLVFWCWQDLQRTKLVNLRSAGGPVKANPARLRVLVFFDD
ncbi:hypothetical protein LMTR13_24920 [Bradyrhizobium icense]|uniref:Uncharacterized protein n=1 Tax=Bradyrhizobium icense TaxID=1274631 RepID=A0A1B1UJE9_9BRAD|nr:hypothetical protein LMTR13_24920 [Bradyrhizobium icense]